MKTIKLFCAAGILLIALLSIVDTAGAVTITNDRHDPGTQGEIIISLTLSELVKEGTFTSSDIKITGEATITDAGCVILLPACSITINPNENSDGDVTVSIAANTFEGVSGNKNSAWSYTVTLPDRKKPTLTITAPPGTKKDAFDITITASEPLTGFTADDITFNPTGAATATLTGSGKAWTARVTPAANIDRTVTITIPKDAVTDTVGNKNPAASQTVTIDTKPPILTLTVPDGPHRQPFEITVTRSESGTTVSGGITPGDVTIAPAGAVSIPTNQALWGMSPLTIPVIPAANTDETVTITIAAGIWQDAVGNQNPAASTTVEIDNIPPTLTMTAPTNLLQNSAFDITITASEAITEFIASDITITPTSAATATLTGSGTTWTATITPEDDIHEVAYFNIPAGAVEDTAGNGTATNTAASSWVYIDTRPPTLTLTPPTTPQNKAFSITIEASEALKADNTLTASDITITPTGAATATLTANASPDNTWTATITPEDDIQGTVTISIPAEAVTDPVGNQNPAASTTVTIDTRPPTLTLTAPTTPRNSDFSMTITASETITGFTADDITITPTGAATVTTFEASASPPNTWTATITPADDIQGTVRFEILSAVRDTAGNENPSASTTVAIDTRPPTLTLTPPTTPQNSVFDITITADETITGFTTSDITINPTSAATATLTPSTSPPNTWTATLTPVGVRDEAVTISIPANAVTDTVGNQNLSASTTVTIDTQPPTLTSVEVPEGVQRGGFDVTFTFSEAVFGFETTDIDYTGSTVVVDDTALVAVDDADVATDTDLTGIVASRYTFRVTPHEDAEGNVRIRIPAGAVADTATNLLVAPRADLTVTVAVEPGWVPDPSLRQLVRVTLGFSESARFSKADMLNIDTLAGPYLRIMDLKGLEYASNLRELTLNGNLISDLSPLSALTELTTLDLSDNSISDISPLEAELIYLTELNLSTNQIEDIMPLALLKAVTTLDLSENSISDLTVLSELTALQHLYLTTNQIEDVSPLADLPNLKTLRISGNPLTDTAALIGLAETVETDVHIPSLVPDDALRAAIKVQLELPAAAKLTRAVMKKLTTLEAGLRGINNLRGLQYAENLTALNLEGNAIKDLTPLEPLLKLTSLDLSGNAVSDLTPLEELTTLETLDLSGNAISNLAPLEELTTLETLDLSGNAIHDIDALSDLDALITLRLNKNPIDDLSPLARLTGLQTLEIRTCAVKDVAAISGLTELLELDLSDNAISDISGLEDLTELTTLKLNTNRIESLEGVALMAYLTVLDIARNAVKDISPLADVRSLIALDASNNAITEVSALSQLKALTVLRLSQNAIRVVNPIMGLRELKVLEAHSNSIDDVSKLDTLTALERLDLRRNNISKIRALAELSELSVLGLAENPILDTSPLYPLTRRNPPVYIDISVERYAPWDVNEDGRVNTADLESVTKALGQTDKDILDRRTDVNADGSVDASDLALVEANIDASAAPVMNRRVEISVMQRENRRPEKTALLANYPNPFNPETWIPYTLAVGADVEISIYDADGRRIRHLDIGARPAGYYTEKNRAAYWDGKNAFGEPVASGVYYYVLMADDFAATRKMLILK